MASNFVLKMIAGLFFLSAAAITATFGNKDCSSPLPLDHGTVIVKTNSTTQVALYSCDAGYSFIGAKERVCLNGTWSGNEGGCFKFSEPSDDYAVDHAVDRFRRGTCVRIGYLCAVGGRICCRGYRCVRIGWTPRCCSPGEAQRIGWQHCLYQGIQN